MLKIVLKHRAVSGFFLASLVLVVFAGIWSAVALGGLNQPLILHFSEISGITRTGNIFDLLSLSGFGLIMVALNYYLALLLEPRAGFLSKLVTGTTLFLAVLIFITISAIISVN